MKLESPLPVRRLFLRLEKILALAIDTQRKNKWADGLGCRDREQTPRHAHWATEKDAGRGALPTLSHFLSFFGARATHLVSRLVGAGAKEWVGRDSKLPPHVASDINQSNTFGKRSHLKMLE